MSLYSYQDPKDFEDATRTTQEIPEELNIDDAAAEIQRGDFRKPGFFGDASSSKGFAAFSGAVNAAASFAGAAQVLRQELGQSGDGRYRLTEGEMRELMKVAASIANLANLPFDVVEDFLIILCYVDNYEDLVTIADGVQVAELADATLIRKPMLILSIPTLYRIGYAASALEGLIHLFRRFLRAADNTNNGDDNDLGSILSALGSFVGGFGSGGLGGATERLNNGSSADALGNFMSELLTGKRIPMTVIAKNPNLQSPSYAGKAFFGESPAALSLVDITQLFNKKIAEFPRPSSGAGSTSFGIQNMGSMAGSMSLQSVVSKLVTGSSAIQEGTKKFNMLSGMIDQVKDLTGGKLDEVLDIRRADTAIPMMSAVSAALSGTPKSLFSSDTFQKGWTLANGVTHHIDVTSPNSVLQAIRKFT